MLFDLRWYRSPDSLEITNNPLSFASANTQYDSTMSFSNESSKPCIISLAYNLLKTLSFHCQVARNCILKYKDSKEILAEYCGRVISDYYF